MAEAEKTEGETMLSDKKLDKEFAAEFYAARDAFNENNAKSVANWQTVFDRALSSPNDCYTVLFTKGTRNVRAALLCFNSQVVNKEGRKVVDAEEVKHTINPATVEVSKEEPKVDETVEPPLDPNSVGGDLSAPEPAERVRLKKHKVDV